MKIKNRQIPKINVFVSILLVTFTIACGPTIYYLGDQYQPTTQLDVFYDAKDVKKEYKTIGQLTHDKMMDYGTVEIKSQMIEEGKRRGADAIIFTDTEVVRENGEEGDRLSVKAKLIKFLD